VTAAPAIVDAYEAHPQKLTVSGFEDLLHNKAQDIRANVFQPLIDKYKNANVVVSSIGDNIRAAATSEPGKYNPNAYSPLAKLEPAQHQEITDFADHYNGTMKLGELEADLQEANKQLKGFYKKSAVDKNAALSLSGSIAKYEALADGARDVLYNRLKQLEPGSMPDVAQKQYGALKELERVVAKRVPVAERQNPLSLGEILTMAGASSEAVTAIMQGHPLYALGGVLAVGATQVAKHVNSSDSLTRRGVRALIREQKGPGVIGKVGSALSKIPVAAPAGAMAGEHITVRTEDGGIHVLPPDQWNAVLAAHPGTKLLHGTPTDAPQPAAPVQ
jgi:hypothetical protein